MWRGDPGIHPSDRLSRMRLMTDRVEAVIGLHHCGNVVRGVVEFFFSLTISKIEDSRGLTNVDFTEVPGLSMVHDGGFQKRRAQYEHGGQTIVIKGMHHQHEDSPRRLAWDPEIVVVDRTTAGIRGIVSLHSPEFTPSVLRIGCLGEWSPEELTEFMQLMIGWLIRGNQMDYCVSTLQISAMSRGCFTSYSPIRDPGDFTTYEQRFAWRDFVNDALGDMECTTC
jgi:hypothetical protein